tara:strand:- start:336 stop:491 length:156 start_codon:yes stop_codon:yes gene_type:complete
VVGDAWYGGWNVAITGSNDVTAYDAITTHAALDVTSSKHVGTNARYGSTIT